jgi:hypothetical protein
MRFKTSNIFNLIAIFGLLLVTPFQVWGATSGTVDIRVSHINDDAEEYDNGDIYINSSDLDLLNSGDRAVGIRFQNVNVPQGPTITCAYIEFEEDDDQSDNGTVTLVFKGEDHDDAPQFSTSNNDITDRTPTTASVSWDNVPVWDTGDSHQSPALTTIVQEIVDRDGWSEGNAMVFIITSSSDARRVAESYDDDSNKAPLLHIEYTSNAVVVRVADSSDDAEEADSGSMYVDSTDLDLLNDDDRAVGIRFQNVSVPSGVLITSAYLEFVSEETDSEATDLVIKGEAVDDAPAFSQTDNDITSRATTAQSVEWNAVAEWDSVDEKHNTPDISAVVQEIVGRAGWSSGNAMAFIITGNGRRVAYSYDGSSDKAPVLRIEYALGDVPYISVSDLNLGATCYTGSNAPAAAFTISNTGSVASSYTVSDDAAWLTVSTSHSGDLNAGLPLSIRSPTAVHPSVPEPMEPP